MNNTKIKRCPFCGGTADLWRKGSKYGPIIMVQCDVCGATSKCFNWYKDEGEDWAESLSAYRALDAWNRRIDNAKET